MHLRDPAVAVGHDDVEPDHRGLGTRGEDLRRRRLPAEPRVVVVRVDLAVQPELEPGQLLPGRAQEPGDAVVPGDVGERVGVADVGGEQLGDAGLPRRRVGLVERRDVALGEGGEVGHPYLLGGVVRSAPSLLPPAPRRDDLRGNRIHLPRR
ncbi:hypothetical protein Ae406Ps2_5727 [Pseudonocardia sp. Ae406_Ps2]|nr:hypothetical protein Ae331Ps2_0232c [Pseudonocardia sp. Ae331_Ps2]OLM05727.1 hypothetical protein Ae406Ps2_5727 [Pseudonocardia sp. Ae406_Ps2]OLM15115.1 hypothetical protein Ae505Ps2_5247c [Pseudonocardia sp. Ae505_Ps2]OLM27303.1 hypothetical protein Ae706Ps2_5737 [Pseudonocardia sp. Ae706_Ps2]